MAGIVTIPTTHYSILDDHQAQKMGKNINNNIIHLYCHCYNLIYKHYYLQGNIRIKPNILNYNSLLYRCNLDNVSVDVKSEKNQKKKEEPKSRSLLIVAN